MSTASIAQQAAQAARSDDPHSDRLLAAMLQAAEQQDRATRRTLTLLGSLLVVSLLANIALAALVLGQAMTATGYGISVGVGG